MSGLTRIEDFRGVHTGKRLFLLASGPSLGTHDLAPLGRRLVMGLNRSFLVYPDTHYNCTMDHRLFDLYPTELRQARYLFTLTERPWGIPIPLLGAEGFSWDLRHGIYSGYTVAYFAMQVAAYMGFTELVYLGLDLAHERGRTHFFGTDYHSQDHEQTEFPKMRRMLENGARTLAEAGIVAYNASPTSALGGFEPITYAGALAL